MYAENYQIDSSIDQTLDRTFHIVIDETQEVVPLRYEPDADAASISASLPLSQGLRSNAASQRIREFPSPAKMPDDPMDLSIDDTESGNHILESSKRIRRPRYDNSQQSIIDKLQDSDLDEEQVAGSSQMLNILDSQTQSFNQQLSPKNYQMDEEVTAVPDPLDQLLVIDANDFFPGANQIDPNDIQIDGPNNDAQTQDEGIRGFEQQVEIDENSDYSPEKRAQQDLPHGPVQDTVQPAPTTSVNFLAPKGPAIKRTSPNKPKKLGPLSRALHQMIRRHESEATINRFQGAFPDQSMADTSTVDVPEFTRNSTSVVASAWGVDVIKSSISDTRKIMVRTGAPIPKDPVFY